MADYAQGNPLAFETFVNRHKGRVFGYARRILERDELASEATQESFLKLHAKIHLYRLGEPALKWFFVIVHRTCLDLKRRERRFDVKEHPMNAAQEFTESGSLVGASGEAVRAAVDKLPRDAQQLLHDRIFNEQSFEDIAKQSKRSTSALRKAYSRLIAKLKVDLGLSPGGAPKGTKNDQ